jgi:hypothetical protein
MQKIKVYIVSIVVIFVIATAGISAQSMQVVDDLIAAEAAGFGDTVYMIAVGSGLADESLPVSDTVDLVTDKGWNPAKKSANEAISCGDLAFIIMQAFELEGGLMYSLLPSPRYALRELIYLGLLERKTHPGSTLSGADVIRILAGAIDIKEAR